MLLIVFRGGQAWEPLLGWVAELISLASLQRLLGHDRLTTTEIYLTYRPRKQYVSFKVSGRDDGQPGKGVGYMDFVERKFCETVLYNFLTMPLVFPKCFAAPGLKKLIEREDSFA